MMSTAEEGISRIDAAQRQLDAAITLWIEDGDALAVHTVAMASYGLLSDLTAAKDRAFQKHAEAQIEEAMGHAEFRQIANQLKHADRDPEGRVVVPTHQLNESIIGGALVFFRVITDRHSALMGAFHLMMLSTHPEKFNVVEDDDPDVEAGAQEFARLARADITVRRAAVSANLAMIEAGHLPANINLRRKHHSH